MAATQSTIQQKQDLGERTKQFALRIIRLADALPNRWVAQTIGKQVLRCGTSVGAQYREGRRARSSAEYISKVESALQELDETGYWLEARRRERHILNCSIDIAAKRS
jgi:four helix bundle protein